MSKEYSVVEFNTNSEGVTGIKNLHVKKGIDVDLTNATPIRTIRDGDGIKRGFVFEKRIADGRIDLTVREEYLNKEGLEVLSWVFTDEFTQTLTDNKYGVKLIYRYNHNYGSNDSYYDSAPDKTLEIEQMTEEKFKEFRVVTKKLFKPEDDSDSVVIAVKKKTSNFWNESLIEYVLNKDGNLKNIKIGSHHYGKSIDYLGYFRESHCYY